MPVQTEPSPAQPNPHQLYAKIEITILASITHPGTYFVFGYDLRTREWTVALDDILSAKHWTLADIMTSSAIPRAVRLTLRDMMQAAGAWEPERA